MVADHKPERRPAPDRRLVSLRNERQSLIRARPHRTTHSDSDPTAVRPPKDVSRLASVCFIRICICNGLPVPAIRRRKLQPRHRRRPHEVRRRRL